MNDERIKISQLDSAISIDGTEVLPIVQNGVTKKITTDNLLRDVNNSLEEIEEKIEDVYSTDEVKTNKVWIDGKSIYRKCFSGTVTSTNDFILGRIGSFDTIVNMYGFSATTGYTTSLFQYWDETLKCIVQIKNDTGEIYLNSANTFLNKSYTLVIEYTKTTD